MSIFFSWGYYDETLPITCFKNRIFLSYSPDSRDQVVSGGSFSWGMSFCSWMTPFSLCFYFSLQWHPCFLLGSFSVSFSWWCLWKFSRYPPLKPHLTSLNVFLWYIKTEIMIPIYETVWDTIQSLTIRFLGSFWNNPWPTNWGKFWSSRLRVTVTLKTLDVSKVN